MIDHYNYPLNYSVYNPYDCYFDDMFKDAPLDLLSIAQTSGIDHYTYKLDNSDYDFIFVVLNLIFSDIVLIRLPSIVLSSLIIIHCGIYLLKIFRPSESDFLCVNAKKTEFKCPTGKYMVCIFIDSIFLSNENQKYIQYLLYFVFCLSVHQE